MAENQKSPCDDCRFIGAESKYDIDQYYCKSRKEWINPDKISKCDRRKDDKKETPKEQEPETPKYIKDRANEILDKGDPVKHIFDTHQSLHIGDEILTYTRIAAVGNQSASNTKGIQPAADGASGKGKSDGDKKFVHLLPKEYVLSGSLSDKVIYYKKDLKPGSYIHSDDVELSDDLNSTIKRATSNFQGYTPHHTLDKDRNVIENSIPPRIVWALNSVDNVNSLQLLNRQFGCSVDESPEQDQRVLEYQITCGMLGTEELPETDDVLICREIIRDIKKHLFKVVIPFNYLIEWRDASNRRNFDMFEDMIRGFAVYRYRQRETHGDILFANMQDFDDAVKLYGKRKEQQGRKLTDAELKLIKAISSAGVSDSKLLQELTGLSQGRISHLIKGKGKDSDSGLIHKVKGLHYEKVTESTDIGTATKTYYSISGFDEEQYKESVVWIDDIARKEFEGYYQDITSLLLSKITNSKEDITHITNITILHSNKKYNNLLQHILLCTFSEKGNKGNNLSTDNDSKGNKPGNKLGNITSKSKDWLDSYCKGYQKPDSEGDMSYRLMQMTEAYRKNFKTPSQEAYRICKDYSKSRGW